MMIRENKTGAWDADPKQIERARIHLAVWLARQPSGELVRMIMDWLDDADLQRFCRRYLDDAGMARLAPLPAEPER